MGIFWVTELEDLPLDEDLLLVSTKDNTVVLGKFADDKTFQGVSNLGGIVTVEHKDILAWSYWELPPYYEKFDTPTSKLKPEPCPHCGNELVYDEDSDTWAGSEYEDKSCGVCEIVQVDTLNISDWNKRT